MTFSFNMSMPVLSQYAVSMGASLTIAGTLSGIFAITALVIRPVSGIISDRLNKRNLMAVSVFVTAIAMIGYYLSQNIYMLFAFRILHGAAFGISSTVNVALVSTLIPKKRLGEGLSLFGLAQIITMALGPSAGVEIGTNLGYSYCFLFSGLILVVAVSLILLFRYSPPIHKIEKNKTKQIAIKNFIATESIVLAIVGGCFSVINGIISAYLVLYGDFLNVKGIGIYFTANAVVLIISRIFLGRLIDRIKLKYIVFPALASGIIAMICMGSAQSIWLILLAAVFYALGQGTGQPAIQSTCIKQAGENRRGIATSTFYLGADIGQGIGPMIGGAISQYFGYKTMFYLGIIPLLIGMLLFALYLISNKRKRKIEIAELSQYIE